MKCDDVLIKGRVTSVLSTVASKPNMLRLRFFPFSIFDLLRNAPRPQGLDLSDFREALRNRSLAELREHRILDLGREFVEERANICRNDADTGHICPSFEEALIFDNREIDLAQSYVFRRSRQLNATFFSDSRSDDAGPRERDQNHTYQGGVGAQTGRQFHTRASPLRFPRNGEGKDNLQGRWEP